jgi:hypothetical protein
VRFNAGAGGLEPYPESAAIKVAVEAASCVVLAKLAMLLLICICDAPPLPALDLGLVEEEEGVA